MVGRLLVLSLLLIAGSAAARADHIPSDAVRAYNQALDTGESASIIAAAQALGHQAALNPDDPQSGMVAFEMANQLCLRAACAYAVEAATFASTHAGEGLPDSRERAVLAALANWYASPNKQTIRTLGAHLKDLGDLTPTTVTVMAYEAYYSDAVGKLIDLNRRATAAANHMKPVRNMVPKNWALAEMTAASSQFQRNHSIESIQAMAELQEWLDDMKRATSPDPDWLNDYFFRAWAWTTAMNAYFTTEKGYGSELREIDAMSARRKEARLKTSSPNASDDTDHKRHCKGNFSEPPRPVFPKEAARRGYVGAVIMGFSLEDGEITNIRVLAAVPDSAFEKASIEALENARFEFSAQQEDPDCRRNQETVLQSFEYVLR
tara:strand:- start:69 stop:1202 length:1134 start_codon:yes stop_codon:yes gene_type:complete